MTDLPKATPAATEAIVELIHEMLPEGEPRLAYEKEIARGGIGAIGIAIDRALRRHVAMKTLHARTYDEPILVRGFIREAQITGQLNHPNIVPVHDFGVDESGQLFFTMKLVEGKSLRKISPTAGRRAPTTATPTSACSTASRSSSRSATRWPSPTAAACSTATSRRRT